MTVFTGGEGPDSFYGTTGADTLSGLGGADSLNGGGGNNLIKAGDGDDVITTTWGADTVDGGTGFDIWVGQRGPATTALAFVFDGVTDTASLTGGTKLDNIEYISLTGGSGNDNFTANGPATYNSSYYLDFDGGSGHDRLTVNNSQSTSPDYYNQITSPDGATFSGSVNAVDFQNIEYLGISFGNSTDFVTATASPLISGGTLSLDGGGGDDALSLDFSALPAVIFDISNPTLSTNISGLIIKNFEYINLDLPKEFNNYVKMSAGGDWVVSGMGDDTIDGGGGDDVIFGSGGHDILSGSAGNDTLFSTGSATIDGGAGDDFWHGTYNSSGDLIFAYDGSTGSGSLTGGTVLTDIEHIDLATGSGNDSVFVNNLMDTAGYIGQHFVGGDGFDTLTISGFGPTEAELNRIGDYGSGLGGNIGSMTFNGYESVNISLGATDDRVAVYASYLGGNNLTIDGGFGNDLLEIDADYASLTIDATNGWISSNGLMAINFERYSILLTGPYGSDIILAAGADSVRGSAGDDTIDGGGGRDILIGGGGNDVIISRWDAASVSGGDNDDLFISGTAADTFDGGAGNDTVDYRQGSVGQWVDLRINAGSGGDALIDVESIVGSGYADTLTGSNGANTLDGGAGNDLLDGSDGFDTVSYELAAAGVTVSLARQGVAQDTHGAGVDTLNAFECLTGSAFGDQLNGDGFNNIIRAGAGNDTAEGGAGDDFLDGGSGVNLLSYYHATTGVTVDLTWLAPQNTGMGLDTLSNFQNLNGSAYGDILRAGAGTHAVAAYGGADTVYIDNGAAGSYDGGADIDTLSFAKATQGVKASLAVTSVQATGIGSMSFSNFEAVVGSAYADSLTGSALANTLTGGGGADTLVGGAGVDVFRYLLASDSTVAAADLINDFQHGIDKLNLTAVRTGAADKYAISIVGSNTQLDVDLHGDGSIDMRVLLVGKSVLTSADLVW